MGNRHVVEARNEPRAVEAVTVARQRTRPRSDPRRFLRRASFLLLLAWLPATIGALGVAPLTWWAVAAGYAGISWLLPGILVRAAVRDWARDRAIPHHRAAGLIAGSLAGLVFLLVAAAVIGA